MTAGPRLWWLSPVAISLTIGALAIIPTALVDDQTFRETWRTPKSITDDTLVLFACGALAIAFGAMIGKALTRRTPTADGWPALSPELLILMRRATTVLLALTLTGYAGFVMLMVRAGITPAMILDTSDDAILRDSIGTIPGVTTLTQLGIVVAVISTTTLVQDYNRTDLTKILTVVGLAIPRAYINSERLAILELAVPIVVIVAAKLSTGSASRRRITQLVPVAGLFAVVAMFGTFEYFRSWKFYRVHGDATFLEFTLSRFAGYYVTALNNGHLVLNHLDWPGRWPFDTLDAFWSAPGIEQIELYERLGGHVRPNNRSLQSPYFDVLNQYGNPELNNPSGYVAPFIDYGTIGGLLFFLVVGIVAGLLYRQFVASNAVGLLIYPVYWVGLVEMPRYVYWVQGRTTYAWLAFALILLLSHRTARKAKARRQRDQFLADSQDRELVTPIG
jgi:oligosaccharide repeat unit polymerase